MADAKISWAIVKHDAPYFIGAQWKRGEPAPTALSVMEELNMLALHVICLRCEDTARGGDTARGEDVRTRHTFTIGGRLFAYFLACEIAAPLHTSPVKH